MKNVVECYKEFFGYFNALETNSEYACLYIGYVKIYVIKFELEAFTILIKIGLP